MSDRYYIARGTWKIEDNLWNVYDRNKNYPKSSTGHWCVVIGASLKQAEKFCAESNAKPAELNAQGKDGE